MKASLITSSVILLFAVLGCGGQQQFKFEQQNVLQFENAQFQKWVAGIKGGGAGYNLIFVIKEPKDIVLDSVYFKKWKVKLLSDKIHHYSAIINDGSNNMADHPVSGTIQMENESELATDTPFELEENEAVISYLEGSSRKYYKLILKEAQILTRPQIRQ